MTTPLCQPNSVVAGDSLAFLVSNPAAPVADWILQFVIGTAAPTVVLATVSGDQFLVTLTAAVSANLAPGVYTATSVYTKAATQERVTARNGLFYVFPNPLVAVPTTWAKDTLALVEAALQKLGQSANSQVAINGQTFTKQNINSLLAFRDRLRAEIGFENAAIGLPGQGQSKTIRTRFVS